MAGVDPLRHKGDGIVVNDVWIVLISVCAGWVLSMFTPAATRWLTRKRRRRSFALLVCPILDKFVADCQAAINDEGRYRNGNRLPSVPMPTEPEFPAEIDWTSINAAMAYRILSLRAATARVDHELRYVEEELHDPPENEPWFSYRRKRCLQLASEASDLSTDLRPSPKLAPEARTAATGSR